jgi:hypothetical protein
MHLRTGGRDIHSSGTFTILTDALLTPEFADNAVFSLKNMPVFFSPPERLLCACCVNQLS